MSTRPSKLKVDRPLAGIPKVDERGRTVDVHALRHTFGTHLSKGGVAPRTAQAALRHSSIDLTMNVYTDPKLLDVYGALDALPALPLNDNRQERHQATGTEGANSLLAPLLAPTPDNSSKLGSIVDKVTRKRDERHDQQQNVVSVEIVKRKQPSSTADNGLQKPE